MFPDISLQKENTSLDGSKKYVWQTSDGLHFESALVDLDYRIPSKVICVSSSIGCSIGCLFCTTGKKYYRNMSKKEIIEQIVNVVKLNKLDAVAHSKKFEISFMAMGEPLLNDINLKGTFDWIEEKYKNDVEVTVSTSGLVDKIYNLSKLKYSFDIDLQISLHFTNQYLRDRLMPGLKDSIDDIIKASEYYSQKQNRKVCINYLLLENVNDSLSDLVLLKNILNPKYHYVKLSEINTDDQMYKRSSDDKFNSFYSYLTLNGIEAKIFKSKGKDIGAGCGQLAANSDPKIKHSAKQNIEIL